MRATSAATELRSRIAEATAASKARAAPSRGSGRAPGTAAPPGRMRWCTTSSARISSGIATSRRTWMLDVVEERQRHARSPGVPFHHRQDEQRHPGQRRQHDDAAAQQLQPVSGQMSPPQDLVQRPAEHQREINRVVRGRARMDPLPAIEPEATMMLSREPCWSATVNWLWGEEIRGGDPRSKMDLGPASGGIRRSRRLRRLPH